MKRIAMELSGEVDRCELILCSSDKESLDGVILSTKSGRIAILDGTAPHTVDPKFPGAVAEIVNLGEGWDDKKLTARRDEVITLTRAKGKAYSEAYETLSTAGRVKERIRSITEEHFDKKRAEVAAQIMLSDNEKYTSEISTRLLSSFGKQGNFFLPVSENLEKTKIRGEYHSAALFMSVLKVLATKQGCVKALLPSALDGNCYDGFLTNNKAYIVAEEGFSADEFLTDFSEKETSELEALEHIHDELLLLAQEHFLRASEYHFSLEDIYSSLMDYAKNEEKLQTVKSQCAEAIGL
ncbi:MAG: hypothetical protein IKV20_00390 [Clostridia bacterium]|nr:hypothetical protein [Clostridia bacterium]